MASRQVADGGPAAAEKGRLDGACAPLSPLVVHRTAVLRTLNSPAAPLLSSGIVEALESGERLVGDLQRLIVHACWSSQCARRDHSIRWTPRTIAGPGTLLQKGRAQVHAQRWVGGIGRDRLAEELCRLCTPRVSARDASRVMQSVFSHLENFSLR